MYKYLVTILLLLAFFSSKSQDTLSMHPSFAWSGDTVNFNDTITLTCNVQNDGPNTVTQGFSLFVKVYSNGTNIVHWDSTYVGNTTINPGDTFNLTTSWDVNPQYYAPGNNITVIWPANGSSHTRDSLILNSYVDTTLGLIVHQIVDVTLYPNPSHDFIRVKNRQAPLGEVRILSMNGRLIFRSTNEHHVDVSSLSPGTYILEIVETNGARGSALFIKQ